METVATQSIPRGIRFACIACREVRSDNYNSLWNGYPVCNTCVVHYKKCSDCGMFIRKDYQGSFCPECKEH